MRHKQALSEASERKWNSVLDDLQKQIPGPMYRAFIAPVAVRETESGLDLIAPDENRRRHLDKHYLDLIEKVWRKQASSGRIRILTEEKQRRVEAPVSVPSASFLPDPGNAPVIAEILNLQFRAPILIVEGPTSSGKSELLKCIESRALAAKQTVMRSSLDSFILDFALACKKKSTLEFRKSWKQAQIVMIDDAQFLKAGAKQTQEELRHLAEHCLGGGSKLILACDQSIGSLPLREDLKSRLESGQRITLALPDFAARVALFERYLGEARASASPETIERAARTIRDPRALRSLAMQLSLDPSLELPSAAPELPVILKHTARFCGLTVEEILGHGRDRRISGARHMAMYLVSELLGHSPTRIARDFGRKSHTAVLYALDRMRKEMTEDLFVANQLADLRRQILAD